MNSGLCLSVSGGGILGVGPAHYLARLEGDLKCPLYERLIAQSGTSTGSILAGGMAEGISAVEMENLYIEEGRKIFTKYPWYKRLLPTCPPFDNSNLKKILQDKFKGKVGEWSKPTFIPCVYMNGASDEKIWDNNDAEDKWFAILTSCAAPTYFDVIVDTIGRSFCDGGLWANSCPDDLMAGMYAKGQRNIRILNLETGMTTPPLNIKGNQTMLGWAKYILKHWVARSSKAAAFRCKAVMGEKNFFNVAPVVHNSFDMDDVSCIQSIIEIWDKQYDEDREKLLKFVNP